MEYRFKADSDIDAYGETQSVIHFKFGDMRKQYHFTDDLLGVHPKFCSEYAKYWLSRPSLFSDPLAILNYIETFNIPVRLYSNYYDAEFADINAAREYLASEYGGQGKDGLYKYDLKTHGYIGLDGEVSK